MGVSHHNNGQSPGAVQGFAGMLPPRRRLLEPLRAAAHVKRVSGLATWCRELQAAHCRSVPTHGARPEASAVRCRALDLRAVFVTASRVPERARQLERPHDRVPRQGRLDQPALARRLPAGLRARGAGARGARLQRGVPRRRGEWVRADQWRRVPGAAKHDLAPPLGHARRLEHELRRARRRSYLPAQPRLPLRVVPRQRLELKRLRGREPGGARLHGGQPLEPRARRRLPLQRADGDRLPPGAARERRPRHLERRCRDGLWSAGYAGGRVLRPAGGRVPRI